MGGGGGQSVGYKRGRYGDQWAKTLSCGDPISTTP